MLKTENKSELLAQFSCILNGKKSQDLYKLTMAWIGSPNIRLSPPVIVCKQEICIYKYIFFHLK